MDRRHFLLTSLAGAAPTHLFTPATAPPHEPSAPSEFPTHAEKLWALANELQGLSALVESYGYIVMQDMDEADPHRGRTLGLLYVGQDLTELTGRLRALAGGRPPSRPAGQ
jgi:hypothetical protein